MSGQRERVALVIRESAVEETDSGETAVLRQPGETAVDSQSFETAGEAGDGVAVTLDRVRRPTGGDPALVACQFVPRRRTPRRI